MLRLGLLVGHPTCPSPGASILLVHLPICLTTHCPSHLFSALLDRPFSPHPLIYGHTFTAELVLESMSDHDKTLLQPPEKLHTTCRKKAYIDYMAHEALYGHPPVCSSSHLPSSLLQALPTATLAFFSPLSCVLCNDSFYIPT